MGPLSNFDATLEYKIQIVCNVTISNFRFNGTAIIFYVSGEEGTAGLCRIRVPTSLVDSTYKVFVNAKEVPNTLLLCSNITHSYLYFTYNHSTQEVIIIPEFPAMLTVLLFATLTIPTTIIAKSRFRRKFET